MLLRAQEEKFGFFFAVVIPGSLFASVSEDPSPFEVPLAPVIFGKQVTLPLPTLKSILKIQEYNNISRSHQELII